MQPGCGPLPHELLLVPPVPVLPVGGAGPALPPAMPVTTTAGMSPAAPWTRASRPPRHGQERREQINADVRPNRLAGVGLPRRLDELHRTRGMRQKRALPLPNRCAYLYRPTYLHLGQVILRTRTQPPDLCELPLGASHEKRRRYLGIGRGAGLPDALSGFALGNH